ncbi:MAG TPA: UPF0182 family protein [Longimicrobiales bacterium]|nr:UPF0182 family protein [Longimicrobiales bacterium]
MPRHPARLAVPIILGLLLLLFVGKAVVNLLTEVLWFSEVGYLDVFWQRFWTETTVRALTTALAGAVILVNLWLVARRLGPVHVRRRYGNLEISEQIPRRNVMTGITLAAALTGLWLSDVKFGGDLSLGVLTWLRRVPWGQTDPLFGHDLSFYVFALPFYLQLVDYLLLISFWSVVLCVLGYALVGSIRWRTNRLHVDDRPRVHLAFLIAAAIALFGVRYWLNRYGVLFNGTGFSGGIGYTDVHARLPAQSALAVLSLGVAASVVYGARRRNWIVPIGGAVLLVVASIVLSYLYPTVIQKLRVEPDQLRRESTYIRWNIDYTRRAFGLDSIERRTYPLKRTGSTTAGTLSYLSLWDGNPLHTVFEERETRVRYFQFNGVDFDRYATPNGMRQVAIGVREFEAAGLPEGSRTWQNLHLNPEYVRGVGGVAVPVNEKDQGRPVYWLHNVPPQLAPQAPPQLALTQPNVYFGETMGEYAVLATEADTANYTGPAPRGISIAGFARTFAFAWHLSDKNLLFSGQLTDSSRILLRRRLDDRLRALAPFVVWDADAQPVVSEGRFVWLVDGYSATANFPLSRPIRIQAGEVGYLRPSLKALVDAVTGETVLYALTNSDPWLETYRAAFPSLFEPATEMPAELQAHLRYPAYFLRVQAEILQQYHLDQPDAFYAGEDVWQLPRERGAEPGVQEFQPLYTMLPLEPGAVPEFVLTAPFIARERQVLTAFLAVRNDPPNYGRMVLLEMPRDEQIAGPTQVEALIEQDPIISPQLTLWRTAGSEVDVGQVRILPIDSTLLYVIPYFVAAQGVRIPELHRIVASDGERVIMAPSLPEALAGLRGASGAPEPAALPTTAPAPTIPTTASDWSARALQLLEAAETSLRGGDWAGYGARLRELRQLLEDAARNQGTRR